MARVIMVAYSCDPSESSEGGLGWTLAAGLARRHRITLLTRPKARPAIETALAGEPDLHLDVEYHEMHGLRRLKYLGLPVSNLRYLAWNHRVADRVVELEETGRFDLVHQTTWVRHWMPSAGARTSLPFVWGPVGAAEQTPWPLLPTLRPTAWPGELIRRVAPHLFNLDPLMRRTRRTASIAFASSRDTATVLARQGVPVRTLPSVGFDPAEMPAGPFDPPSPDFISVGRLLGWKGFHLGIEAFARWAPPGSRYEIVGDGPEMARLVELARRRGVADRVTFRGRLPREKALERIGASRMLVHPSMHDSGGFVVVEAQALGVPVLCLDIGGPAFLSEGAGFQVAPGAEQQVIDGLGAVMADPESRSASASARAREHAHSQLTWTRIVGAYEEAYSELVPVV